MSAAGWNHNVHYHGILLNSVPLNCGRALDVGCGQGLLARQLAPRCEEVVAIEVDHDTLARAKSACSSEARLTFVEADVMTHPFPDGSFDLITVVATLHHLPLKAALIRFRGLLRPGGVLAVVGLYRAQTLADYAVSAAAFPTSWILRSLHHYEAVRAPLQNPVETLTEIRAVCRTVLPGAVLRRRLLFRYSLIWRKP